MHIHPKKQSLNLFPLHKKNLDDLRALGIFNLSIVLYCQAEKVALQDVIENFY